MVRNLICALNIMIFAHSAHAMGQQEDSCSNNDNASSLQKPSVESHLVGNAAPTSSVHASLKINTQEEFKEVHETAIKHAESLGNLLNYRPANNDDKQAKKELIATYAFTLEQILEALIAHQSEKRAHFYQSKK
jgi:3'-phosphoadenosine 5'-phosphosulfate sulfotransferase (PAPS reductase)/FAD synthetase